MIQEFLPFNKAEANPDTQQNKHIDFPFHVNFTNQWGKKETVGMEKVRQKNCKCYLRKVIVISLPPCPWSHSATASLPITALIKTDKVSLNEERAAGGLNR